MVIFKNHIGSNNFYSCFKSNYWNSEYISAHTHLQIMESNEEIRRYARRDRQMKSRSRSHTPMDVDTDPFSFDQMRYQLDGIQQANSNYEENKSSCSRSHSSTQSFEEKMKNLLIQSQNQDMLRFRICERRILKIIETNKI